MTKNHFLIYIKIFYIIDQNFVNMFFFFPLIEQIIEGLYKSSTSIFFILFPPRVCVDRTETSWIVTRGERYVPERREKKLQNSLAEKGKSLTNDEIFKESRSRVHDDCGHARWKSKQAQCEKLIELGTGNSGFAKRDRTPQIQYKELLTAKPRRWRGSKTLRKEDNFWGTGRRFATSQ